MRLHAILVFFSLAMLLYSSCAKVNNSKMRKKDLTEIVETKVSHFLESIPDEYLYNFGIKGQAEIKKATTGNPITVYNIVEDSLLPTNTWRVPLEIDEEYKVLLTLSKDVNDNYEIVDFGAKVLAKEISTVDHEKDFKGMVRIYELRQDFFVFENNKGELKFQPIPNTGKNRFTMKEIIKMMN